MQSTSWKCTGCPPGQSNWTAQLASTFLRKPAAAHLLAHVRKKPAASSPKPEAAKKTTAASKKKRGAVKATPAASKTTPQAAEYKKQQKLQAKAAREEYKKQQKMQAKAEREKIRLEQQLAQNIALRDALLQARRRCGQAQQSQPQEMPALSMTAEDRDYLPSNGRVGSATHYQETGADGPDTSSDSQILTSSSPLEEEEEESDRLVFEGLAEEAESD